MYQVSTSISADNTSKRQHVLLFGVLVIVRMHQQRFYAI